METVEKQRDAGGPNGGTVATPAAAALRRGQAPLYRQVAVLLERKIVNGTFKAEQRLPSIERLAREYGVSVITIRQAIELLEAGGLLRREQGRGTFVTRAAQIRRWLRLESNWDSLLRMWEASSARILKVGDAVESPNLDESDGLPAPSYHFMRRVHLAENTPYAVIDIYVDRRLYQRCPDRFDREMVVVVLDEMTDVKITDVRQVLTIGSADLDVATLLGIAANAPTGEVRRVIRDQRGTVIYVGEAVYRGDLVQLELNLERHGERRA